MGFGEVVAGKTVRSQRLKLFKLAKKKGGGI